MKSKIVIGISLIVVLVAIIAFSALSHNIETPGLEVVAINVLDPEPSLLDSRYIAIDLGESVTLDVKVLNKGDNITQRDAYTVSIDVIYPDTGARYWLLPTEQLIRVDLGPGGKSSHSFKLKNRIEVPFSGKFRVQAVIKSADTCKEIARSDKVTIEITYPEYNNS
ncbi:hypothetical protein C5S53_07115 [Methanophagales archaeon]|nr:hypothetical protein C5S53_07115 [Methanophagales archaeon]